MAFGAWFRMDDATLLLTARAVRNALATSTPSSRCRFPGNRMNRDYMDVMLLGGTG
jgi:hypothetical protein